MRNITEVSVQAKQWEVGAEDGTEFVITWVSEGQGEIATVLKVNLYEGGDAENGPSLESYLEPFATIVGAFPPDPDEILDEAMRMNDESYCSALER